MSRILSWKIDNNTYAYIFTVSGSHISTRIEANDPMWEPIMREITPWTFDIYKSNYLAMANEVESKYPYTMPKTDKDIEGFYGSKAEGLQVVLLAGKDGVGGSGSAGSGNVDFGENNEIYEEFNKKIEEELKKARDKILEHNNEIKDLIETSARDQVSEAKDILKNTKEELDKIREELEKKLGNAEDALDAARELFKEGNISPDAIIDVLKNMDEYSKWVNNSDIIAELYADYDVATGRLGSVGVASAATDGLFARFATSLNVISGTVGNVERSMNASEASITDMATWYDTYASAATEVIRFMSASGACISDTINYISGGDITIAMSSIMDAKDGTMRDSILAETQSGLTNLERSMNAFSASIVDQIAYLAPDSAVTSMGDEMDAMNAKMERWITKTDSAMSLTHELRDHWSVESGKLSTVANLVAAVDADGNIMYFVSGATESEEDDIQVWKHEDGKWRDNPSDGLGNVYEDKDVFVHYSEAIGSYIHQQVSSITMSVMGKDNLTAAIQMIIENDEAIINMVADKVVIDADLITRAISAKTANIGGILIGNGKVECMATKGGRPMFLLNGHDGSLYAQNACIDGAITATSLHLGSAFGDKSLQEYVNDKIPTDVTSSDDVQDMINRFINSDEFKNSITDGYITEKELEEWYKKNATEWDEDQLRKLIQEVAGSEVSFPMESEQMEDGGWRHTVTVGGKEYKWETYDFGEYLHIGGVTSGMSGDVKTSFLVSKEGLLTATNAWISGKIYASEGYFQGDVAANSLTIGGMDATAFVRNQIPSDVPTLGDVQNYIQSALTEMDIEDLGFITPEQLEEWFKTKSGITETEAEAIINRLVGAQVNVPMEPKSDGSGGTIYTVSIGGKEYSWTTVDGGNYVVLDKSVSGSTSGTSFVLSKQGLLQAYNAIIYGEIHAQRGAIGGFTIDEDTLQSNDGASVIRGNVSSDNDEDLFKLGVNKTEKIVLYAFKASGSTSSSGATKPVSADTKFSRIYLTQEYIKEGEEVMGYYLNNDLVNNNNALVTRNKLYEFESGDLRVMDVNPTKGWWGNSITRYNAKNAIQLKAQISGGGWGQQIQGQTTTRYEFYVRDKSGDYDLTAETCSASGLPIYNTRITSNGIVHCNTLNAEEGYFSGTINSDGFFSGELNCEKGALNNAMLNNTEFYNSAYLNSAATLYATDSNNKRYLTVSPYSVEDVSKKNYPNATYNRYIKNSNGNNFGQTYYAGPTTASTVNLVDIPVPSGATVKIPKITIDLTRYIPSQKLGYDCSISVKYSLGNTNGTLVSGGLQSKMGKGTQTSTTASTETSLTATADTRLVIYTSYAIHLPTYSWLGADKATATINIRNSANIEVTPSGAINNGVVIGNDGFMVVCGNCGLKVTDTGAVQVRTGGTWKVLNI